MTEKKTRVRVASFSVSLDGYGAAADQSLENPMGIGGMDVHNWVFSTRWWKQIRGEEGKESIQWLQITASCSKQSYLVLHVNNA